MRKMWPILLILVILLGIGGYFLLSNKVFLSKSNNPSANTTGDKAEVDAPKSTCDGITVAVEEGPYFVANTAKLANNEVNYTKLPGAPIKVIGYVFDGTDKPNKPIANAKLDIWQADTAGVYHPEANGDVSQYKKEELGLRGYVTTDSKGYYEFTSIYPGYYEGRARHIHVIISADGYNPVTTQIIFQPKPGDGVMFSDDSIAQSLPECHLLEMSSMNGYDEGAIDFRLQKAE
jgi:protocatechuate 3,4-dioxygenase beta subunit